MTIPWNSRFVLYKNALNDDLWHDLFNWCLSVFLFQSVERTCMDWQVSKKLFCEPMSHKNINFFTYTYRFYHPKAVKYAPVQLISRNVCLRFFCYCRLASIFHPTTSLAHYIAVWNDGKVESEVDLVTQFCKLDIFIKMQ